MTTVPYAMKTEAPEKSSAVGSLVWRGGLNQRLAEIISQEYHRIGKPVPGTAKMAVYREWGVMLGIEAADGDGSRLRKAVTRLLKDFDRAYAVFATGDGDEDIFLRICPECHVLLPVLRPSKSGSSRSLSIHGQRDDQGSRAATRVSKRQRDEEPQDLLKSRENNTNVGDEEMDSTAPPRKRGRATIGSARQVLLDDVSASAAGALHRQPRATELAAVPRIRSPFAGYDAQVVTQSADSANVLADCPGEPVAWSIQSDRQATLLAEHARAVGDPSIIHAADLLISLLAGCFKPPSSDAGTTGRRIGKATSVQKPKRNLVRPGKTVKKT
jgi:hypothetical protein